MLQNTSIPLSDEEGYTVYTPVSFLHFLNFVQSSGESARISKKQIIHDKSIFNPKKDSLSTDKVLLKLCFSFHSQFWINCKTYEQIFFSFAHLSYSFLLSD